MRAFLRKFRVDPYWRAFAEIGMSAIFTFLPILLFSIPLLDGGQKISRENILSNFISYWNSGELVLPILGICGAITSVVALNKESIKGVQIFFSLAFMVLAAAGGGYLLGNNRGFLTDLHIEIVWALFGAYLFLLVIWFGLAVAVNHGPEKGPSSDERANDLLKGARERQKEAGR